MLKGPKHVYNTLGYTRILFLFFERQIYLMNQTTQLYIYIYGA